MTKTEESSILINNRQAGRRRGRGGQRPPGIGGRPEGGNRIDNRARGNASQLLEKYRNLARDSQMQGDRVTTEYYLQFADHYFRVLNENRPRDEQPRRMRDDEDDDGDFESQEGDRHDRDEPRNEEPRRDRDERRERRPRREREERVETGQDGGNRDDAAEVAQDMHAEAPVERPRRGRRPRVQSDAAESAQGAVRSDEDRAGEDRPGEQSFADRLPPPIAPVSRDESEEEAPAPRRRTRRPRSVEGGVDETIEAA